MPRKDSVTIYTTPSFVADFELEPISVNTVALPVQEMAKRFMAEGRPYDICIMPYVTQCKSLLTTFRSKNLLGPIVFVSEEPVDTSITYDIHRQGAILVDVRNQQKDFMKLILIYIIENQRLMKTAFEKKPLVLAWAVFC